MNSKKLNILSLLHYLLPFTGAILGMGIAYCVKPKTPSGFKLILAFSGAFLLGITLFHLLPKVYSIPNNDIGIWIVGGIITQILLEYLSQGAEHGHTHVKKNSSLPWILMLSLSVHAFIEGLPLQFEQPLIWGIFIHKIPIGMVLFFVLWESTATLFTKLFCLFFFALMTPLGTFIFESTSFFQVWEFPILAVVIGMLLHIATTILFESNQGHAFNFKKLLTILIAFGISFLL